MDVTDLVLVDPLTGERDNCGVIARKRTLGSVQLWLTYDEPNRMWWIVWQDCGVKKAGYIESRREICWRTFLEMTEKDLAELRPS